MGLSWVRWRPLVGYAVGLSVAACGAGPAATSSSSVSTPAPVAATATPCPATTSVPPPARMGAAMTYDAATKTVILFSGIRGDSSPPLTDTWTWDGCRWTQQTPPASPPGRSFGSLAFDQRSGRVVLFGGGSANSDPTRNDTWTWNGNTWEQAHPATSPPLMTDVLMDYDRGNQALVLWGVTLQQGGQPATWTWDGANWTERHPAARPPIRFQPALAFGARAGVLLFGGKPGEVGALNDTWVWDGNAWQQLHPVTSPGGGAALMVHEDGRHDVLMIEHDGTWTWDGSNWRHLTLSPSFEWFRSIAYDAAQGRVVLFGGKSPETNLGTSEFWAWDGANWSRL